MPQEVRLQMDDGFFGTIRLPNRYAFAAPILNLGTMGMNIAIPKRVQSSVSNGDRMELVGIVGAANLDFISRIPAEIIRINPGEHDSYVAADCAFPELGDDVREQVDRFVTAERKLRGQYRKDPIR